MKQSHILHLFIAIVLSFIARAALSQSMIANSVTTDRAANVSHGRDFWFVEMSSDWGQDVGEKSERIYIASQKNTTAYVSSQGTTTPVSVTAGKVATFPIPRIWEMESSGELESKGIHVWSNDADLIVYTISLNDYPAEGCFIIPTPGWGKDYVVAAAPPLFVPNFRWDFPSMMAVVASEANTTVSIVPTCDCRQCWSGTDTGDLNSTIVVYHAGAIATFVLNAGQSVQLMPVLATGYLGFDLSGTVVHATHPVGVFGGSQQVNIPAQSYSSAAVQEMIPSVQSWGSTYYVTSFYQSFTQPLHDSALYLLAASQPGQKIFRSNCSGTVDTLCTIGTQYGIFYTELYKANKLWSATPFLCMEYSNSYNYPDTTTGLGGPSETSINARERYLKTVQFLAPTPGVPAENYANIVVNLKDTAKTLLDSKPITSLINPQCLDNNWVVFQDNKFPAGSHIVTGDDSGVSVQVYGYLIEEGQYSMGSEELYTNLNSPDTMAPRVTISGRCFESFIHIADSGLLPNRIDTQSGIGSIYLDSEYNVTYVPDLNFIPGSGVDTSGYEVYVNDIHKPAYLRIEIVDMAGNQTTIRSTFGAQLDSIIVPLQNLGVNIQPAPPNIAYDTLYNDGSQPFSIDVLHLLYGNLGFSLHDAAGGPPDLSPIPAHSRRLLQIQFSAVRPTHVVDSIIFGSMCDTMSVAVIGSGGGNDFYVTNQTWANELMPAPEGGYIKTVDIVSYALDTITINKPYWADTAHFKIAMSQGDSMTHFPLRLPPAPAMVPVSISFFPGLQFNEDTTRGTWTSPQVLVNGKEDPRFDFLNGAGITPSETMGSDTTVLAECQPPGTTLAAEITIASTGRFKTTISQVTQSNGNNPNFQPFDLASGTALDGSNFDPSQPFAISKGQSVTITVRYTVPDTKSAVIYDTIYAYDAEDNPVPGSPVIVTFLSTYRILTVPATIDLGAVNFPGSPVVTSFWVSNTNNSPVSIDSLELLPGNFTNSFAVTTAPSLPTIILPGDSIEVNLTYNDSLFDNPEQQVTIVYQSDACQQYQTNVTVTIANSGVAENSAPKMPSVISIGGNALEIIVPSANVSEATFELYDLLGERVISHILHGTETVNIGALAREMYFWRITTNNTMASGKIFLGN